MADSVKNELRTVADSLDLSMRRLAQLLDASKNSVTAWASGEPVGTPLHAAIIRGVAAHLARMDPRLLPPWRGRLERLPREVRRIDALRVLIDVPHDPLQAAVLILQDVPREVRRVTLRRKGPVVYASEEDPELAHLRSGRRRRVRTAPEAETVPARVITERLDLTIAQLAELLSASRQAAHRWFDGKPGRGLYAIISDLAEDLANADEQWTLPAWRRKVHDALDGASAFDKLGALVNRPPTRKARDQAIATLQNGPRWSFSVGDPSVRLAERSMRMRLGEDLSDEVRNLPEDKVTDEMLPAGLQEIRKRHRQVSATIDAAAAKEARIAKLARVEKKRRRAGRNTAKKLRTR